MPISSLHPDGGLWILPMPLYRITPLPSKSLRKSEGLRLPQTDQSLPIATTEAYHPCPPPSSSPGCDCVFMQGQDCGRQLFPGMPHLHFLFSLKNKCTVEHSAEIKTWRTTCCPQPQVRNPWSNTTPALIAEFSSA